MLNGIDLPILFIFDTTEHTERKKKTLN